jgi:hypothetical protein
MKRKIFFRPAMLAMALFVMQNGQAQVSVEQNWPLNPGTDYVGWDNTTTVPLMVRHDANQPIQWYTDALRRMQLYQTLNNVSLNGFNGLNHSGYLGLSGNPAFFTFSLPFSRLHLADTSQFTGINAQALGFRDWQRNGITFTGNGDHGYFGQEHNGQDTTDMVLSWSNDFGTGLFSPDHLSIRFMSNHTGAASGANSLKGLEAMRFFPVDRERVNVGIGDWFAGNISDPSITEPTEILDVLEGRVRIRQLPTELEADTLIQYVVVDSNGVLGWRNLPPPSGGGSGADCDWEYAPSIFQLTTAWRPDLTNGCPDRRWKLGVGKSNPSSKLDIEHNETNGGLIAGLSVKFHADPVGWAHGIKAELLPNQGGLQFAVGVQGSAVGIDSVGTGVYGVVTATPTDGHVKEISGVYGYANATTGNTKSAYGIRGEVVSQSSASITTAYGAHSKAGGTSITNSFGLYATAKDGVNTYGVYGYAHTGTNRYSIYGRSPGGGASDWSGYFEGPIRVGSITYPSDENLKTNIEDLSDPVALLRQLQPKRYNYRSEEFPQLGLPHGLRYGFLAQEVAEHFPQFVTDVHHPETLDSLGNVEIPGLDYKGLSTADLIPILVAAVQQHASVNEDLTSSMEEMRARLDHLEQLLAACCNRPDGSQLAPQDELQKADPRTERLLRMDPNPFTDQTTVRYTLERGGRVSLLVHGSAGQHIQVLHEAPMEQGEYSQVWRTSHLAPGIYYVTLLLDGEPLVKRAVKVQ